MLFFKNLIFDEVPFIELAEIDFSVPIIIWIISILFLIVGLFTRFFSVINYLMSLVVISTMDSFEYHTFYAYMGMNSISLKTKRKFKIKCKKIKTIVNWEKDFLTNQINKPWFDIGQVLWENNEFNCTVLDVEKF